VKYFRIFKAKKPIGQLSEAERNAFASELASNILDNLVSPEMRKLTLELGDAVAEDFKDTAADFIRICQAREILKTIEGEILNVAFEKHANEYLQYLNSIGSISEKNLIDVSLSYLSLNWIDDAIHKRSLDVYSRLLEIRSSLNRLNLWTGELEAAYREASFGKSQYKPGTFVTCSVVIKQKDKKKLFDSTWDSDFGPAFNSSAYQESLELGSAKIWKAISGGMIPDLNLVFREFSGWLK
jgi:hypothetical protein